MNNKHVKKIRILKLYELLKNETDEDSPISTEEIILRMNEMGLEVERKTVYDDIDCLNECGFEIMQKRERTNKYYVADRNFNDVEIQMLTDAVFSANFITEKKAQDLADRLCALSGKKHGELLKESCSVFKKEKHHNEQIWYNVDAIREAISKNKKISFKYFSYDIDGNPVYRKNGKIYTVNPLGLIYAEDNYYLVSFDDKYKNPANYRVDRMTNVEMSHEPITNAEWVKDFDLSEYRLHSFSMYGGEEKQIAFLAENSLADVIFDKFGHDTKLKAYDERHFTFRKDVAVSPTFFAWLSIFGGKIKIVSPKKTVRDYVNYLKKALEDQEE